MTALAEIKRYVEEHRARAKIAKEAKEVTAQSDLQSTSSAHAAPAPTPSGSAVQLEGAKTIQKRPARTNAIDEDSAEKDQLTPKKMKFSLDTKKDQVVYIDLTDDSEAA